MLTNLKISNVCFLLPGLKLSVPERGVGLHHDAKLTAYINNILVHIVGVGLNLVH